MQADSAARAHSAGAHRAATVWLTGLSGAGKSTIATALVGALLADGIAAVFTPKDFELTRIMTEIAELATAGRA